MNVCSRLIVSWGLEAKNAKEVLERTIEAYGKPEIVRGHGSRYAKALESLGGRISMDGRCLGERFWHTLKTGYAYLHPHAKVPHMRLGISGCINCYNTDRGHIRLNGLASQTILLEAAWPNEIR